jgi:small subunit ribosomal protein S19
MPRSLKKGPYIEERLIKRIAGLRKEDKAIVKVWKRAVTISPEMVGFTFGVHNGKEFVPVYATEDMVGHKLGEFSPTTKFARHGGKMQKDQETKAKAKEAAPVVAVNKK